MYAKPGGSDFADGQAYTINANKSFVKNILQQRLILRFKPNLAVIF